MKQNLLSLRLALLSTSLLATANLALATDIEQWTGIPNVSATTNWSDHNSWGGASQNPNDNHVFFGNDTAVAQGVINSVVDTSTNCYSLNFTNSASYNNLLLLPHVTLKIDGATFLNNGINASISNAAIFAVPSGQASANNTISGQYGTVLITGPAAGGVFVQSTNSSAQGIAPVLDMSGLGTFVISNTAGSSCLWVGNGANRSDGVLYLAMTNYLELRTNGVGNASALVVGDNTGNIGGSPGGVLNLGQVNTILADNIGVGMSKQNGALFRFNPVFTNADANPSVTIRGFSGTAVKKWSIGDGLNQSGTSASGSGTNDFQNGTVQAAVTVMVIGRASPISTTAPNSAGALSLSAGTISVTTLTNAAMTTIAGVTGSGSPTNQIATGTINVTGTATFNAVNVVTAILLGTGGSSTGTFNVTNGTLAVDTISTGGGTSTINLSGGTLIVTNTVGTTASPLTTLNLTSANLKFSVDGTVNQTNIVATTVNTSFTTTITINSVTGVNSNTTTVPLISYKGVDPYSGLTLAPLPGGYAGALVDNSANNRIDLQVARTVNTTPTNIVASVSGGLLTLSWPRDHIGWTLQAQTNTIASGLHTANWVDVPGSTTVRAYFTPIDPSKGTVFYRLILNP
jgi:hypothetical protein